MECKMLWGEGKAPTGNAKNKAISFIYFLDIIFIVWSHGSAPIPLIENWMPYYSFHVELFVFCSGYLYNSDHEKNIKKYIMSKIKNLLLPLYFWNLFYGILLTILRHNGFEFGAESFNLHSLFLSPIIHGHQYGFNLGGWFVVPLLMVEIANVIVMRLFARNSCVRAVIPWVYILIGILGLYYSIYEYDHGWNLWLPVLRFTFFLMFFGIGFLFRKYESYIMNIRNEIYFAVIFMIQIALLFKYRTIPTFSSSGMNVCESESPYIIILAALLGIAFWVRVAYVIEPIIKESKVVEIISNNTFSIMINHYLGFFIVNFIYALCYKFGIRYFNDFNMNEFKNNMAYEYLINGISQMNVFYSMAGIVIPVLMQIGINKMLKIARGR